MQEPLSMELFFQFENEAVERARSLRVRGLEVEMTAYEGGHGLAISGPQELVEASGASLRQNGRPRSLAS